MTKKVLVAFLLFIGLVALGRFRLLDDSRFVSSLTDELTHSPTSVKDAPAGEAGTTQFIVFGDSGTGDSTQRQLAKVMLSYPFDFILHTGDIAYPDGTAEQLQKNFFEIYTEHLKRASFYPSPGNHDYHTDNLEPYLQVFNVTRYYSFSTGNAHFIALDTNNISSEHLSWLEKDLAASGDMWNFVFFHHPPYSSGVQHGGNLTVVKKIVPILEKYNVDLVFSGHEHNYERMCPIRQGTCENGGVTYVVTGGGSGKIYPFGNPIEQSASRSAQTHFIHVNISGCKLTLQAINKEGKIIDTLSLTKCP